jgi:hypothetical protein
MLNFKVIAAAATAAAAAAAGIESVFTTKRNHHLW